MTLPLDIGNLKLCRAHVVLCMPLLLLLYDTAKEGAATAASKDCGAGNWVGTANQTEATYSRVAVHLQRG